MFLLLSITSKANDDKYQRYQKILLIGDDSVKCSRLIFFAEKIADSLYDYNFAQLCFQKAHTLLRQNHFPSLELQLYSKWGLLMYRKGEFEEADKLYLKALSFKSLDDMPEEKARVLNRAAVNLQELQLFKRALGYYNEALEIYGRLNDNEGKAMVYVNMANVFAMSGNLEQSDQFFDKAGKIFLDLGKMSGYSTVLGNKAFIKWKVGDPESGKRLLLQSLAAAPVDSKNMNGKIERIFNIGIIYGELKKWDSCFYYLDEGKRMSDSFNLSEAFEGSYYFNVGYCSQLKGDLRKGIEYYKKALALKTGISHYRSLYDNISSLYFRMKQYDSAFYYKNISHYIADSIYKSELQEHIKFENKRIELVEEDYEIRMKAAEQEQNLDSLKKRNYLLLSVTFILVISVLLLFVYFRQYKLKEKKEHLESELNFLRAQLNPHFLFNSINNIYVLLDDNKERASEILLKFSDLLRYQLYECNTSSISLSKEINFLANFIEFEKLRYSNKIVVDCNLSLAENSNLQIAPLLLQPFIENAFKHTPKSKGAQSIITIKTEVKDKQLILEVTNSCDSQATSALPGGIGLENVKKRLKLLYPNRHELKITATETTYTTILILKLQND